MAKTNSDLGPEALAESKRLQELFASIKCEDIKILAVQRAIPDICPIHWVSGFPRFEDISSAIHCEISIRAFTASDAAEAMGYDGETFYQKAVEVELRAHYACWKQWLDSVQAQSPA